MSPLSESLIGKERVSVFGREDQVGKNIGQGLRHMYTTSYQPVIATRFQR